MKIYRCDGEIYTDNKKCEETTTDELRGLYPRNWITIDVNRIENDLPNNRLIACSSALMHFCSKDCLNNYLFKNTTNND